MLNQKTLALFIVVGAMASASQAQLSFGPNETIPLFLGGGAQIPLETLQAGGSSGSPSSFEQITLQLQTY